MRQLLDTAATLVTRPVARALARSFVVTGWCLVPYAAIELFSCHGDFPDHASTTAAFFAFLGILLVGVELAQIQLEETAKHWFAAVGLALGWWLVLVTTFTVARLLAVYSCAVAGSLDVREGFRAVGEALDYLVTQGRAGDTSVWSSGASGPLWAHRSEEGVFFGRVQALAIPPLGLWTTYRIAKSARPWWLRVILPLAILPALVVVHAAVAHRYPPFTYRRPGVEGFHDVLGQCLGVVVLGVCGLPVALGVADAITGAGAKARGRAGRSGSPNDGVARSS